MYVLYLVVSKKQWRRLFLVRQDALGMHCSEELVLGVSWHGFDEITIEMAEAIGDVGEVQVRATGVGDAQKVICQGIGDLDAHWLIHDRALEKFTPALL